jgi:hypothetical protein
VNIADNTAPFLSVGGCVRSSLPSASLARAGAIINTTITTSETVTTPSAIIAGQTATVSGSGSTFTALITVNQSAQQGWVSWGLKSYTDLAGNAGTETLTSVTNSNCGVFVDTIAPTFTAVCLQSNNAYSSSFATTGDIVTITANASEAITTPLITFSGQSFQTMTILAPNLTFTATYTVKSTDSAVGFSISNFADALGNAGLVANVVSSNACGVSVDQTPPFVTITVDSVANNGYSNKSSVNIRLTLSEASANFDSNSVVLTSCPLTAAFSKDSTCGINLVPNTVWCGTCSPSNRNNVSITVLAHSFTDRVGLLNQRDTTFSFVSAQGPPEVSVIVLNENGSPFATNGERVTITVIANEPISVPQVSIYSNRYLFTGVGCVGNGLHCFNYTATYDLRIGDVLTNMNVRVESYSNRAGSAGTTFTGTFNLVEATPTPTPIIEPYVASALQFQLVLNGISATQVNGSVKSVIVNQLISAGELESTCNHAHHHFLVCDECLH